MLPEWKSLRKKSKKLEIPDEPYFELAEEYIALTSKFVFEGILNNALLWFDMIIYPLYILVRLCMMDFSPMYMFSLMKTYQLWIDWLRFRELREKVDNWKMKVKSVGGPWISTNDPDYHVFVYADGMERIKYALRSRPKKLAKGAK